MLCLVGIAFHCFLISPLSFWQRLKQAILKLGEGASSNSKSFEALSTHVGIPEHVNNVFFIEVSGKVKPLLPIAKNGS